MPGLDRPSGPTDATVGVTFALASLGVVAVPAGLVEPVIAASITVVAVLGARSRRDDRASGWRTPMTFGFGLLHGLGFASALGIDEPASCGLVWSLLAFNVGIEVAQLALIAAAFPVLMRLRASLGPRLITTVSVAVAVVGAFWLLQRLPVTSALVAARRHR